MSYTGEEREHDEKQAAINLEWLKMRVMAAAVLMGPNRENNRHNIQEAVSKADNIIEEAQK